MKFQNKMKRENLLYIIIVLLVFIFGFLLGDKMNNTGRYVAKEYNLILDTKEGILYFLKGDQYLTVDLKTEEKKIVKYKIAKD